MSVIASIAKNGENSKYNLDKYSDSLQNIVIQIYNLDSIA